jgi:hypothetical protein
MEPMTEPPLTPAAKLRLALDLFESGVALIRQQLRRKHPEETAEEIERRVSAWLSTRPGAEHGDAPGRPRPLPPEWVG